MKFFYQFLDKGNCPIEPESPPASIDDADNIQDALWRLHARVSIPQDTVEIQIWEEPS